MIVAGTGHRPDKFGGYGNESAILTVADRWVWENKENNLTIISGMALGWDMALARAAICYDVPFIAAVPFAGQESRWRPAEQEYYRFLLSKAKRVELVCSSGYAPWKMHARNRWMVDQADMILALYNGEDTGGTAACIKYAQSQQKPIVNLWDTFQGSLPVTTGSEPTNDRCVSPALQREG